MTGQCLIVSAMSVVVPEPEKGAEHSEDAAGSSRDSAVRVRGRTPVRELEVAELRAFVAAATLGSIAEAARAMNISQPAMSKKLKTLESVAGAELFERSTRGVRLTPAGVQLYSAARKLLHSADTVQALIASPAPAMPVRIASTPTVAEMRLPQVLTQIATVEHTLTAELISANSVLVRELVSDGRCDLGIVSIDPYRQLDDGLEERGGLARRAGHHRPARSPLGPCRRRADRRVCPHARGPARSVVQLEPPGHDDASSAPVTTG